MRSKRLLSILGLIGILAIAAPLSAAPTEGFEYQRIDVPVPTETGSKVEVLELFWYGCPHCFHLEPTLEKWLKTKPANAEFRRLPAVLNDNWAIHAKVFYTAETLGVLEKLHTPLFQAYHEQNNKLKDEAAIRQVFVANGVKAEDFDRAFNSFAVDAKVRRARDLSQRFGIDGVPAIIVNGKYRTSATLTGGHQQTMEVVNFLIAKEGGAAPAK